MTKNKPKRIKIKIKTPCKVNELERAVLRVCHAGACLNSIVTVSNNNIIIEYHHEHT